MTEGPGLGPHTREGGGDIDRRLLHTSVQCLQEATGHLEILLNPRKPHQRISGRK